MKFSIVTLLAAIGYMAMVAAAIVEPNSIWRLCAVTAAFGLFGYFVIMAFDSKDRDKSVFGRVAAIATVTYMLASLNSLPFLQERDWDLFPHERLTIIWFENQPKGDSNLEVRGEIAATKTMIPFFRIQCGLAFGV